MWTLDKPDTDDVAAQLERALSRDRGEAPYKLTVPERDAVVARYEEYDAAGGLACAALAKSAAAPALAKAIHDAYSQVQEGARLESLRSTLKSGAQLCPYCSAPTITDLDHHLPRSIYKDFAIYPRNLVPSCHPCNNIKRAFDPKIDAENLIQPYLDQLPEVPFLVATTTLSPRGALTVVYWVDIGAADEEQLLKRAQFQIEKFELNDRFRTAINVFLAGLKDAFDLAFGAGGGPALSAFLGKTTASHVSAFGLNDWRTALLRSLAANDEFCSGGYQQALGGLTFGNGMA
ncbi:HNH endonuclease [Phenylobacterium sp.]|uniref:HNH endonuclease n=1 Tax=Phenylobacterium sp. TaxID=1871053 RepID=UPI0025E0948D|nr:HNH endonuclease [Phenylobacterium sp.]MCA3747211.1 HNH endonuclease [Phenylobacterium sp.]